MQITHVARWEGWVYYRLVYNYDFHVFWLDVFLT